MLRTCRQPALALKACNAMASLVSLKEEDLKLLLRRTNSWVGLVSWRKNIVYKNGGSYLALFGILGGV